MEIIKPHKIKSRVCKESDIDRIVRAAKRMSQMCSERIGFMKGGYALSHQQVENEDPLTFFVLREGETIVNPKILNHTKTTVDSRELCLSFPYINREILKQRWNVIEVEYYGIYGEGFTKKRKRLSGKESHVWQHEMDHFDCKYIFDI